MCTRMRFKLAMVEIIGVFLMGCATGTLPMQEPITLNLGNVRVHVVTAQDQLPEPLGVSRMGAAGAAWTRGMECDIYVFGQTDEEGRIFVSEFVLGHELRHLLNHKDSRFYVWD